MSVPVHDTSSVAAMPTVQQRFAVLPSPQVTTVPTNVSPPTPLPNLNFPQLPSASDNQHVSPNAAIARIPYPSTATSAISTQSLQKIPSNALNKPYRTKRVFKVIILGDAGVGKTCLSFRFCNGRFPAQTEATIGVDFRERSVVIDGELIRVQLWDTAGQERYRQSIVSHYYRNVNAVVFVYDVSNPASFRSLSTWISECRSHAVSASKDTPHILIGNKCDLSPEERVKTDHAQIFADQNDMALFETSALADSEADHVESIFMTLVHKLQQSKPMHVQSDAERALKEERLLLKADEAAKMTAEEGWCC
uniref:Ras-related protein Rab-33 n=1 Tax=Parascaris univalens TaxID=6257 RepID=A0A915AHU4_PARUN